VLTYDLISQRSVPEMFVTASVVRPDDAARVIGKAVQVPIQPGDPIRWSDVAAADGGPGAGPE
jgi:pilus assembly protein CpaB